MSSQYILGVDCGATKVLSQLAFFDKKLDLVFPKGKYSEFLYSSDESWIKNFDPVQIEIQKKELIQNNILLSKNEIIQGNMIIKTIQNALNISKNKRVSICYPGIKDHNGVVIMANGPRIPSLKKILNHYSNFYNDSDCCILGEWKSSVGSMLNVTDGMYIGGGTGIADGVIIKNQLIDFNNEKKLKRSWELMHNGNSIESLLSPAGMIRDFNNKFNKNVRTLDQFIESKKSLFILEQAIEALSILIKDRVKFFKLNKSKLSLIVIGQRLGSFLFNQNNQIKDMFQESTKIPMKFSFDRRTAALGAVYKFNCT
ncbi:MAG: hypothetical protein ACKVHA_03050 [Fidelibacterota bacterium]|jgi:hypothetical protein|tara:strand:+ start:1886 stop:2824 length:939 start_codon:yes stop_codon:yes gene_type:complete